jgi:anti-anti-sigma factor
VPVTVSNFDIRLVEDESTATLFLWGELDRFSADMLDHHLETFRASTRSALVVDANGLSFCDTAGVRAIMRVHDTCVEQGTKIRVVGLQPAVERVFKLTGLTPTLGHTR